MTRGGAEGAEAAERGGGGERGGAGGRALDAVALLVLLYLFLPILVIVLFSFNEPAGQFNFVWKGFSLEAWRHPFRYPALAEAMGLSLRVAAVSTAAATVMGTLLGLALTRYRFRGRRPMNLLLVLPLTTPEVVLGSSLLALFLQLGVPTGFGTIVVAHVMFSVSYVALTVKARLRGFDWSLVEAGMDLGATPLVVLWRVTLPLIAPGVAAAALLSFALSLDDFVITLFNAGSRVTYPLYVYGARRAAFPPQIDVIATAILVGTLALLGATVAWQKKAE